MHQDIVLNSAELDNLAPRNKIQNTTKKMLFNMLSA